MKRVRFLLIIIVLAMIQLPAICKPKKLMYGDNIQYYGEVDKNSTGYSLGRIPSWDDTEENKQGDNPTFVAPYRRGSATVGGVSTNNYMVPTVREKKLALIQKIPTPITPIKLDRNTMHITLAYFEKKSTVDYIGLIQEIPVCFDAKETNKDIFPFG